MLCPEVWNFPPPKLITTYKSNLTYEAVSSVVEHNSFYRSVIITCPDELYIPKNIQETLFEDSNYYKISNCPLTEFLEPIFINSFVKTGKLYCLSTDTSCIIQNCAAITPDGILTLHVLENVYQTLGLIGVKRPHKFYQIDICLKDLKNVERTKNALKKLHMLDFNISWIPETENICPSSIAKYLCDKNYKVSSHSVTAKRLTPTIAQIPSLEGSDMVEVVEWLGMLANGADLLPKEGYTSSYVEPESDKPIKSSRISILIVKGFLTSNIIQNTCKQISEYVISRDMENYWVSISMQSVEESLWQWNSGSPRMFQSQNASCNIFFTSRNHSIYSMGQLKYS